MNRRYGGLAYIWGVGGNYTFGAGMVGLVWSRTQVDNMASVFSFGLGNYVPLGGRLRLDNYEVSAKYALTPALTVSGAHTFTDGAYADGGASASPIWHTVMLQTDYSLSRRTDVYLEGVYQHAHGAPA